MSESSSDHSDAEWLRDFDERNKDVTEDDVRQATGCLCGRGGIFKIGTLCPVHDDPEIEVIAKALAEWSNGMPWERRSPANRQHWLKLARRGYEAMKDEHAKLVMGEHAVTRSVGPVG